MDAMKDVINFLSVDISAKRSVVIAIKIFFISNANKNVKELCFVVTYVKKNVLNNVPHALNNVRLHVIINQSA
jgi:hypothetical protein